MIIVWAAPYPPHGVLTNYDIQYQLVNDSNDPVIQKIDAIHNNITLFRLTPNAHYEVKVSIMCDFAYVHACGVMPMHTFHLNILAHLYTQILC